MRKVRYFWTFSVVRRYFLTLCQPKKVDLDFISKIIFKAVLRHDLSTNNEKVSKSLLVEVLINAKEG